ncbi:hypothetical protein O3P69_015434 [Scylla paramamosain]|uniref:Uncharacterized protein n=1 Tax=Scylla paramamosain TaxID=85552 RepID=A0AAW0T8C7_SCYPA
MSTEAHVHEQWSQEYRTTQGSESCGWNGVYGETYRTYLHGVTDHKSHMEEDLTDRPPILSPPVFLGVCPLTAIPRKANN